MPAPATVVHVRDHQVQPDHHVRIYGRPAGRPVLFLHGFGCSVDEWLGVTPHFEGDHLVVLVDQGEPDPADLRIPPGAEDSSLRRCADDLLDLLRTLDLHDVVVVARSACAAISGLAAHRDPSRIGALALTVPTPGAAEPHDSDELASSAVSDLLDTLHTDYLDCSAWMSPAGAAHSGSIDPARMAAEIRMFTA